MTRQCSSCGGFCKKSGCERENVKTKIPWVYITEEEICDEWITAMQNTEGTRLPIPEFARAIEAKLKEKNGF